VEARRGGCSHFAHLARKEDWGVFWIEVLLVAVNELLFLRLLRYLICAHRHKDIASQISWTTGRLLYRVVKFLPRGVIIESWRINKLHPCYALIWLLAFLIPLWSTSQALFKRRWVIYYEQPLGLHRLQMAIFEHFHFHHLLPVIRLMDVVHLCERPIACCLETFSSIRGLRLTWEGSPRLLWCYGVSFLLKVRSHLRRDLKHPWLYNVRDIWFYWMIVHCYSLALVDLDYWLRYYSLTLQSTFQGWSWFIIDRRLDYIFARVL
jgi:hypothetical protein